MWTFVKIAWRNLWKNKRRTLITASAIAFSITIVIFSIAANEGQHDKMIENTMNIFSGYIQIHRLGFQDDPGVEKSFTIPPEMKKDIETEKDIAAYAPRLQTGALAASDNNSAGAFVVGVDPAKESKITIFNNRIIRGEFLSDKGRKECIIGERMARNLGIKTGSDLVLITQGIDGSTGAIRFKVKGIFRMGAPEFEQTMVLINIEDARDLLRAYDMVNSIVITTKSPDDIYKTVEMLKQKISGEEYEVLGWKELMPDLVQLIDWDNVKDNFFFGLIMMVVIFGVLSAVFSSVLERTNEFGVMLALGTKPNQIILMVMTEAFLLTLLGLAVGLSAGLALSYYYVLNPIEMPQSSASAFEHYGMENRLYFAIKPVRTGITVLVITLLSLFLSFLPAWRASRLKPDEAIRNINQQRGFVMTFLKIAWRNLTKRPIHTGILSLAIATGTLTLVLFLALSEGFFVLMINTIVDNQMGHIQIHRKNYLLTKDVKMIIPETSKVLDAVKAAPHIKAFSPRVLCQGLVSSPEKTLSGTVYGIDPLMEGKVTITQGKLVKGEKLKSGDSKGIFVGETLAEKLKVDLGEKIVVMAQDANGEINGAAFRIRGMYRSGSKDFDRANLYIITEAANELLGVKKDFHEIAIRVDDDINIPAVQSFLKEKLTGSGNENLRQVQIQSWRELSPMLSDQMAMLKSFNIVWFLIIFGALSFGIINAFLMEIFERIREFGIMMSLGTSPGKIFLMLMYEALLLGLLGAGAGVLLSFILIDMILGSKISFGKGLEYMGISNDIPLIITAKTAWDCFIWTVIAVMVATVYPAVKAARFKPMEAMRHI